MRSETAFLKTYLQDIEGHGEYTKSTEDLSLSTETDALCTEVGLVRCRQT